MDELLKRLILENKLTLTLLAMVFAPIGLWAGWRLLNRESAQDSLPGTDVDRRLATIETTLDSLVQEVARMSEQQQRLTSALERERIPAPRAATAAPRLNTPV